MSSDDPRDQLRTAVRKLFGRRPIMAGEDPADYELLMKLVRSDVKPQDLREWLLMKDIVDAEWEVLRLRGLKVTMLHAVIPHAVRAQMFEQRASFPKLVQPLRRHVVGILAGDPTSKEELEKLLEGHGLTLDITIAAAFEKTIIAQAHTDRMAASAYDRRNKAYAELERLRGKPDPDQDLHEMEEEAPPTVPGNGSNPAGGEHQAPGGAAGRGGRRSR